MQCGQTERNAVLGQQPNGVVVDGPSPHSAHGDII